MPIPGFWTFVTSAAILLLVCVYGLRMRYSPIGRAFLLLSGSALLWTVAFVCELLAQTLELKMLFARIQFIGIVTLPLAWLHLALVHTGRRLHKIVWIVIFTIAFATLICILFVPTPNIFWGVPSLIEVGVSSLAVDYDYGPMFTLLLMPFTNFMVISALGLLVHLMVQPHVMYKRQTALIIVATLIPLIMNILYLFGITPIPHINFSTATMSLTGLLVGYALFKYRYLELVPIARDLVFEHMSDAVFVLNREHLVVDANRAARILAGGSDSLIGKDFSLVMHGLSPDPTVDGADSRDRKPVAIADGLFDVSSKHVKDLTGQETCTVVLFHDVTEQELLYRKIEELGKRDPLTGVYNRGTLITSIDRRYHEACAGRSPLSLLMLDIDGFKQINDTYGHEAGDRALETLAQLLVKHTRPTDIIGRYGGDEFVIVSPAADEPAIASLAERIREQVCSRAILTKTSEFPMHVSIGIKTFRFDNAHMLDDPATKLLSEVDAALYAAKRAGKNRIASV